MESEILALEAEIVAAILSSDVKVLDQLLQDQQFVNNIYGNFHRAKLG